MIFCNKNTTPKTIAETPTIMSGLTGKPNSIQVLLCRHKAISCLRDLLSKFKDIHKEFQ